MTFPRTLGFTSMRASLSNPENQSRGDGRTDFSASFKISGADAFWRQDGFRSLCMGADDQRRSGRFQTPSGYYTGDLPYGIFAIAAGAYQRGVRPPDDAIQRCRSKNYSNTMPAVEWWLHPGKFCRV